MVKSKTFILYILILNLVAYTSYSQINRCGTILTDKQRTFEQSFTDSVNAIFEVNRTIDVTLFIVNDAKGEKNLDLTALDAAFSGLNNAFDRIKLSFRISAPNYIDNYHFDILKKNENESDLISQYYDANTINIYFVKTLFDATDQEVCGYTYFPAENKDVILINKSCITESFLIEQFGHFFNLYHTHEIGFAEEAVNESNCKTAGDLCCDTPADPNLSGKVNSECQYSSLDQDKNKEYYTPSVFNYMSFSPDECNKCFFSTDQYLRVINCLLKTKSYLW